MDHKEKPLVSIEEKIIAWRAGDEDALLDILDDFHWMIVKEAKSIYDNTPYNGLEIDDLISVGRMALTDAVTSFEFNRSVFAGYAKLVVRRGIWNYARENMTNNRSVLNGAYSLDATIDDSSTYCLYDSMGKEDPYLSCNHLPEDDIARFLDYVDLHLTHDEKVLTEMRLNGYNYDEIIAFTRWSRKKTFLIAKSVRTKLAKIEIQ